MINAVLTQKKSSYAIIGLKIKMPIKTICFLRLCRSRLESGKSLPTFKGESLLKKQDGVLIAYNIACCRGNIAKLSVDWEN